MTAALQSNKHPAPKPKFWQTQTFRIGGSVLILGLLLTFLPFAQVWAAIKRIPPSVGVGLLFVYLLLHLLGVAKWRLLVNVAGAGLSFRQAVRCYYGGLFGNVFLPSLIGGDVVRGAMAFPVARSKAAVVMGSLIDRTQDVIGLGAIAATGALLSPRSLDPQSRRVFLAFGGAMALLCAVTVVVVLAMPVRKFPMKVRRIMVKLRRASGSMFGHWHLVLLGLGMGVVLQVLQVGLNCFIGVECGLRLSFGVWLFAWPLAKISALLPVTQGGIGVREVALVALLLPFGAPGVLVAAAGLVFEAISTIGGLLAGGIAFLLGRGMSAKAKPFSVLAVVENEGHAAPQE